MKELIGAQNVVVAGLGKTGQACLRFLNGKTKTLTCWDTRLDISIPDEFKKIQVVLGQPKETLWHQTDLLVVSPGLSLTQPDILLAKQHKVKIIGEIELFAYFNTTPLLGITGSNGKTTVTLLVEHILKQNGKAAKAAGNIGEVAIEQLDEKLDWLVLELSSFQLETTHNLHLHGAAILNITDDHLDRHETMAAYRHAKHKIFANAKNSIVNIDDANTIPEVTGNQITYSLREQCVDFGWNENDRSITFRSSDLLSMSECSLVGEHNMTNIQAALALAYCAGISPETAANAVKTFQPAPHRCVQIATIDGVRYIDDSKATNVGATIAAITGLNSTIDGKLILIAGGDGKGADLSVLKPYFHQYVSTVIALGQDGPTLCDYANKGILVDSMFLAVKKAKAIASKGDVVLLSPACASIDMFTSYIARAQAFSNAIEELAS